MRKTPLILAGLFSIASIGLVGCDVEKTQEGNVSVPQYEVTKKAEGDITLPKYDVTTPDIKVGTKETEVNVPKITTEKETLTVPTIGVKTAEEKKAEAVAEKKEEAKKQ